jgi:hypothetical protein
MFMVPACAWTYISGVVYTLLTLAHRHSVIIVSICAQRIYRGLVDSATINGRVQGALSAPRPSSIRFAHLDRREENTRVTGGAVHDLYPQATTQP